MRTFEVLLNGKKLCTAGVGDDGVLTAIVSSVHRRGEAASREDSGAGKVGLRLDVGGLITSTAEQVRWQSRRLHVGDEIRIRIGEAALASKPHRRESTDPAFVAKAEGKYLENAAMRLGWKIVKPRGPRTK
jgi:hypothetical protein